MRDSWDSTPGRMTGASSAGRQAKAGGSGRGAAGGGGEAPALPELHARATLAFDCINHTSLVMPPRQAGPRRRSCDPHAFANTCCHADVELLAQRRVPLKPGSPPVTPNVSD